MKHLITYGFAATMLMAAAEKSGAASGSSKPTTPAPAAKTTETTAAAKPAVVVAAIRADLTMPVRKNNRGSKSKYDFEKLEVGQSIGVVGRNAEELASTVSSANRNKKFQTQKRDATTGALIFNKMRDATGNEIDNPNAPVMENTRHFFVVDTDPAADPDKATARIWRDK